MSNSQAYWLDKGIAKDYSAKAIDILKPKKSPRKDRFSNKFFSTFKDMLLNPLIEVWDDPLLLEGLPKTINEGFIKLIHKNDEEKRLTSQKPITMMNCTYNIFTKALALCLFAQI